MRGFLSLIYTLYAGLIFFLSCLLFIPVMILLAQRQRWHRPALRLHQYWARIIFRLWMIPVVIKGESKLKDHTGPFIFCSNHFSYLDIPAFFLVSRGKFIGKSSLTRIPLFGYFFSKIHIPVDRANRKSRAESLQQSGKAVDQQFNVTFFPEGGVVVEEEDLPYMARFKDGAFRLSMEKDRPVVPVSMVYNFILLPDRKPLRLNRHLCKVVIHDPIYPEGKSEQELSRLRERTYEVIQRELLRHHPDKVKHVG